MAPRSKKNASKFASKFEAENHPKIEPKLKQNGGKMEPNWSQHGIQKSMCFLIGFWKPLETLTGLRGGCDGAAGGLASVTLSPADPPRAAPYYQRLLYKNKQRPLLTGSSTPRAVGSANYSHKICVLGLLFLVLANAEAELYQNGFPQRPLSPETS